MIIDLTRGAVKTKLICTNFSPLISVAEVCYASHLAHERFVVPDDGWDEVETAEALLEQVRPALAAAGRGRDELEESDKRLIRLLEMTKVTGKITDEIRPLLHG